MQLNDALPLPEQEICPNCDGSGIEGLSTDEWEYMQCNCCQGTGKVERKYEVGLRECPECEGKGRVYEEFVAPPPYYATCGWYPCPACDGEGVISDDLYEKYKALTG